MLVGAVALLATLMVWGLMRFAGPDTPPDNGQEIAASFLAEIRAGRVDSAWEGTTAELKSFMGKERFRRFVRAQPALKQPAEPVGSAMISVQGLSRAQCTFRPQSGKGTLKVLLASEDGQWKVERLDIE